MPGDRFFRISGEGLTDPSIRLPIERDLGLFVGDLSLNTGLSLKLEFIEPSDKWVHHPEGFVKQDFAKLHDVLVDSKEPLTRDATSKAWARALQHNPGSIHRLQI